jgi:phosphopantothenoylcysteine decarboxylase
MTTIYLVGCGSYATSSMPELARWCVEQGWDPWVIPSPTGRQFLDVMDAHRSSGNQVFSELVPEATAALPAVDLVVVAPATFNTVTKLAVAASDTLALAVINQALGAGTPVLLVPWCNADLRRHPAFGPALRTLREWGYRVLDADQGTPLPWSAVRSHITSLLTR